MFFKSFSLNSGFLWQINFASFSDILISLLIISYNFIDIYFIFLTVYACFIGLFGLYIKNNRDQKGRIIIPYQHKKHDFTLLICAHNEENVILNTLQEMSHLDYPKELLKIVVICDNCNDKTFEIASRFAKNKKNLFILERKNKEFRGKPHAVKFGFDWIDENLQYEAVSIADADNIYHPDFFNVMNKHLNEGNQIIQGYLGVKNPFETFITSSSAYSYFALCRVHFMGRKRLGLAGCLGGTGFVVTKKAIKEIGWDMKSLVEDFEFSCKSVIKGWHIDYAYDAITYDEKPTDVKTSVTQRSRWSQGHWNVAFRYTKPLLKKLFGRNKVNKFILFDYLLYMWSPGRIILYCWFMITYFILAIFQILNRGDYFVSLVFIGFNLKLFISILPRLMEYYSAVREGFHWWRIVDVFYYYTFFFVQWFPGVIGGLFTWRDQGNWAKTLHKSTVNVTNLSGISLPSSNFNFNDQIGILKDKFKASMEINIHKKVKEATKNQIDIYRERVNNTRLNQQIAQKINNRIRIQLEKN